MRKKISKNAQFLIKLCKFWGKEHKNRKKNAKKKRPETFFGWNYVGKHQFQKNKFKTKKKKQKNSKIGKKNALNLVPKKRHKPCIQENRPPPTLNQ